MRSRLALGLAVLLAACDSGSSSGTSVPNVPWASFRQNNSNSAASGAIISNRGDVTLFELEGVTLSTPTIDRNGNLLIGTENGVVSLDSNGRPRWTFEGFMTAAPPEPRCTVCTLDTPGCIAVGRVSASASVTPGNTILFGTEAEDGQPGRMFSIQQQQNNRIECNFVFPPDDAGPGFSTKSSAPFLIDTLDLSTLSLFVGGDDGRLLALNSDGSVRWSLATGGAITATPAVNANNTVYVTSANGLLSAVDFAGRPLAPPFPVSVGNPLGAPFFRPSPAVATTVYAIGSGGTVVAVNPDGSAKWQSRPPVAAITGSPAFIGQTFTEGPNTIFDTIVYVVEPNGTAFGLRDLNGSLLQYQRCSNADPNDPPTDCRMDSCLPFSGECDATNHCTLAPDMACSRDSCAQNSGSCMTVPICSGSNTGCVNNIQIPAAPATIETSPVLSGDLFVVVGTTDGRVCARTLDGLVPGQFLSPPTANWASGCIDLDMNDASATKSSPIIGANGAIYVTTDAGLYEIR